MDKSYSRRKFLKLGATLVAGSAGSVLMPSPPKVLAMGRDIDTKKNPVDLVKSYCPFCQVRCTYSAVVRDGVVESLIGEKGNPWTGGAVCPKGMSLVELIRRPERIVEPLLKQDDGSWKTISYNEAIDVIVEKLTRCHKEHGEKAGNRIALTAPLWDCHESELAAAMTLHTAGSVHMLPAGEVCISSASNMLGLMTGVNTSTTTVNEICNTEVLVLWGANINDLYPPYSRWLRKAREEGVSIIYIDPRKTKTSQWASWQIMPRPGSDGSLAIGALKYIFDTNAYDPQYAQEVIPELDLLKEDVGGYSYAKVYADTGVDEQTQHQFYKALAGSLRTIIWLGGSISRYTNGIPSLRAMMLLQGLRNNMIGAGKGLLTMEGGKPGGDDEFEEHLFGASTRPKMNFRRLRYAMEKKRIDVLFLNSSYRRYPDSKGVKKALKNVPFVVHRAFFKTEEMDIAHLVVPATFGLESQGSHFGAEKQVVWRDKAVEAPGSCVPDWQFYRDIGYKLAPDKYLYFENPEALYRKFISIVPSWRGITLERLCEAEGGVVWPVFHEGDEELLGTSFVNGKLLTADGTMPVSDRVFGRISWTPCKGSPLGSERNEAFPLIFLQGKVLTQWQQTVTNFSAGLARFSSGRYVHICPETARKQGLDSGDRVLLETETGGVEARVEVVQGIIPGVVFTPSHFDISSSHEQTRSHHINSIVPNYWDRISSQTNGVGCRLTRV